MSVGLPDFMYASALELSDVTVDVNITNAVIDVNITNPQIDVNVVNTSIDVRLIESTITLDVNVTNTTLNVNIASAVTLDVNLVNSSVTLDVNVTNATLDVVITNATINVPISIKESTITLDVNVTNTTLDVSLVNSTITLDVNVTNTTLNVNVSNTPLDINLVNSTITLDVNITNTELNVNVTNTELSVNVVNPQIDIRIVDSTITLNVLAPSGDAVSVGTVKPIIEDLPIPGMAWESIAPGERRTFLDVTGRGKILSITLISRRKNTTLPPDFDFYLNIDGVDYCICAWSLRMMGGLVMESFTPRSGYSDAYKAVHLPRFGGMIEEFYDGSDTWICAIIEPNADFKSSLRIDYHNSNADDDHWVHMIVVYGFYP